LPAYALVDCRQISTTCSRIFASRKIGILPSPVSPNLRLTRQPAFTNAFATVDERCDIVPALAWSSGFPEPEVRRTLRCFSNGLAEVNTAPDSGLGTSCRGPCARHEKEQQVVSCPPRRAPGRLSLRSVRPSVERQDLAGGDIPLPAPSPGRTLASIPVAALAQWSQTQVRGKAWPPQTQVWGTLRWPHTQVWGDAR